MLVELGVVEQQTKAVYEVLEVVEVVKRYGVCRQTVHTWLKKYANEGSLALVDKPSKPDSCSHQMPAVVEARVVEMRRAHPDWGPRTILYFLGREGIDPLPGRSSVYRALLRHRLIEPKTRKRKKKDYKRWEPSKARELWQMDIVGGFHLKVGTELRDRAALLAGFTGTARTRGSRDRQGARGGSLRDAAGALGVRD
ncbi:MAG: helix-turn-helix domain-containing protein [Acidimicrobiales bacterium]